MIHWRAFAALTAAQLTPALQTALPLKRWPRFQNTDYPVTPIPLPIDAATVENHRAVIERYHGMLEKLVRLYREDERVRAYIGLDPAEDALARLPSGLPGEVRICRVDGYLDPVDGHCWILENNADAPAGTLFTGRLNQCVDDLARGAAARAGVAFESMPIDDPRRVLEQFLADYRAWGGRANHPTLAILQERGKANIESAEMAEAFSTWGTETLVADPREFSFGDNGAAFAAGRRIDLCWNKINTVYWRKLAASSPTLLPAWGEAVAGRRLLHLNPFSSRYVAENKRALAIFQEDALAPYLDEAERDLIARHMPWARKLEPGKVVSLDGTEQQLEALLLERQHWFVLKQPYDIRGDGVTIGRTAGRAQWVAAVQRGFAEGHIAQRYLVPTTLPVLDADRGGCISMNISLDSFVFGGRFAGFGAKASLNDRVNVFQGGRKLAALTARITPCGTEQ